MRAQYDNWTLFFGKIFCKKFCRGFIIFDEIEKSKTINSNSSVFDNLTYPFAINAVAEHFLW